MSGAKRSKILAVDHEPHTVEMLVDVLSRHLGARVTCVADAEHALDIDILEPHDALIAEVNLAVMDGVTLAERFCELRRRPVILMSDDADLAQAVAALRVGVVDFFVKPFDLECLLDSTERALCAADEQRRLVQRHHRQRALIRRVIRERRELNQRVDLVCRDLVGAHRRLVHRVFDREQGRL